MLASLIAKVTVALRYPAEPQLFPSEKAGPARSSLECIKQLFQSIMTQVNSLGSLKKKEAIKKIVQLQSEIEHLIRLIKDLTSQLREEEQQYGNEIIATTKKYTSYCQNREKAKEKANETQVRLDRLRELTQSLARDRDNLTKEIETLAEQVVNEQGTRVNGALDLIPFYGLIDGIRTGNPLRAIPFYSAVVAIVSVAEQKLEKAEKRRQTFSEEVELISKEAQSCESKMQTENQDLQSLNNQISALQRHLTIADVKIKRIGKELTDLRNIEAQATEEKTKCESIQFNLGTVVDLVRQNAIKSSEIHLILPA